jgi:hypothetical protein
VPTRSPSRLYAGRTPPRINTRQADPFADPFADDETLRQSFPASEASRYSDAPALTPGGSRHSRSRTMANVPLITHTSPSIASSHRANGSGDSHDSPAIPGGPFNGLGIHRSPSGASDAGPSLYPTPLRSAAARLAQQHQRAPEPALLSATSAGPAGANSRYKRLSNASASSNGSSSLSIEFPSSWGEPGPTRPGSMVEPGAPLAPPRPGGASRVSDPFDLDVPELLSYAESHYSSSSSLAPAPASAPGGRAPPTVATLADDPASRRR